MAPKNNVWAGILRDHVIGPIFFEGNLTGEKYLGMLQNTIQPLVVQAIENNDNLKRQNCFSIRRCSSLLHNCRQGLFGSTISGQEAAAGQGT